MTNERWMPWQVYPITVDAVTELAEGDVIELEPRVYIPEWGKDGPPVVGVLLAVDRERPDRCHYQLDTGRLVRWVPLYAMRYILAEGAKEDEAA